MSVSGAWAQAASRHRCSTHTAGMEGPREPYEQMFGDCSGVWDNCVSSKPPPWTRHPRAPYLDLRKLLLGSSELLANPALGFQLFHCLVRVSGLLLASTGVFPPLAQLLLKFLSQRDTVHHKKEGPLFTTGGVGETFTRFCAEDRLC